MKFVEKDINNKRKLRELSEKLDKSNTIYRNAPQHFAFPPHPMPTVTSL